jgi:RimJ/RimL family protein N-acetyltransferase
VSGPTRFWTGERIRLRAMEPDDWQQLSAINQEGETQRDGDRLLAPISAVLGRKWAQEQSEKPPGGASDDYTMVVETLDGGELAGDLSVGGCDRLNGHFHYGISLGTAHQRRGYASEAVRMMLSFMFGERRYHRCYAEVYGGNAASLALQRRLGFTEEGVRREHAFQGGRYRDLHQFGLLAREFEERERAAGREPYFTW